MTEEQIKDIRLMCDMVSKDLHRLADDVKCLGDYLKPQEDNDVENVRYKDNK